MRKRLIQSAVFATLILVGGSLTTTSAQTQTWHLVQGSDGTLYLVTSNTRYILTPDSISDADLAQLTDGGTLGSQLPVLTVAPTPTVAGLATSTSTPLPVTPSPVTPSPVAGTLQPTATPAPLPGTPTPRQQAVTLTGAGTKNTPAFSLAPGNYAVSWSGSDAGGGGNFMIALNGLNNTNAAVITSVIFKPGQTLTGTTNATNLQGGQYDLVVQAPGSWNVTLTPQ